MAPIFSIIPQNQSIEINKTSQYSLSYSDPEGCQVLMSIAPSMISTFATVSGNKIIFAPTKISQIGIHSIAVTLTDQLGLITSSIFYCTIFVYPRLTSSVPQKIPLLASNN